MYLCKVIQHTHVHALQSNVGKRQCFFFFFSLCRQGSKGQHFLPISPSDGEADVALHLPVCGETVPRDHRASGEGVQLPPQHLLLQQDRHRRQSEPPLGLIMCCFGSDKTGYWQQVLSGQLVRTRTYTCTSLTYTLVS